MRHKPDDLNEKQKKLLELDTRKRIVEELERRPGLNKRLIALHLDLDPVQVTHHVNRLENAGLVERKNGPREREVLVFRTEDLDLWENERTRVLDGRHATRQVAMYIAEHPGTNTDAIAEALDIEAVSVRHHLRKLRDNSLVAMLRVGRNCEYHPSNELQGWTEDVGDAFDCPWRNHG